MLALVFFVHKHGRFRFRSVKCLLIVSVLAAVLVAGCGSSYTRADFIQRADGICTGTTRAVRLLKPPQFGQASVQQQRSSGAYFGHAASLVKSEARRLSALPVPPETGAQRRVRVQWLAAVHDSAAALQALAEATSKGDTAATTAANQRLAANPVVRLAARYGAHACAGPGATYK
jgi:hypothetical protein